MSGRRKNSSRNTNNKWNRGWRAVFALSALQLVALGSALPAHQTPVSAASDKSSSSSAATAARVTEIAAWQICGT